MLPSIYFLFSISIHITFDKNNLNLRLVINILKSHSINLNKKKKTIKKFSIHLYDYKIFKIIS